MDFPEEDYSHLKQENFSSENNCESKPEISLNVRKQVRFTTYQLNELKQIFEKNKNQIPSIDFRNELAKKMGVSSIKIRKWFYYNTYKIRMLKGSSGSDKSESKRLLNLSQRKRFKSHELIELNRIFKCNHYPDENIKNDLAQRMGVSKIKINKWFRSKRYELKQYVSSSTSAGDGYVNFITSSTGDVNYPPFYSPAKTIPPDYSLRHPQFQSQPDLSAPFSAEQYSSHHVLLTHEWTDSDHNHSQPLDLRLTAIQ